MQMADEIPEGSGANSKQNSGGFRCRWLLRFRTVWCRQGLEGSGWLMNEVPDVAGAHSRQSFRGFGYKNFRRFQAVGDNT